MPYYAVYKGFKPGIYNNWNDCNNQITGFSKPVFKKFTFKKEAELFIQTGGIRAFHKHKQVHFFQCNYVVHKMVKCFLLTLQCML